MRIEILDEAQGDLIEGFHFYENRVSGLGSYFVDCLFSDIDSLVLHAGIHQSVFGYHRCLSKRFPFAVLRCGGRIDTGSCRLGLSQESILDQEALDRRLTTACRHGLSR